MTTPPRRLATLVLMTIGCCVHAAEPVILGATDFTIGMKALSTHSIRQQLQDRSQPPIGTDAAALVLAVTRTSSIGNVLSLAVRIDELITDEGEQLAEIPAKAPLTVAEHAQELDARNGHPLPLVHEVSLRIRPPRSSAKELVRMRGSLEVWYETAASRPPLDLHAPATLIGKRIEVGFAGLGLTLATCTDREVVMQLDPALGSHLVGVDFVAGDQLLTKSGVMRSCWLNETCNLRYRRDPPAEVTRIRLRIIGHTAVAIIPIALDRIPLTVREEEG